MGPEQISNTISNEVKSRIKEPVVELLYQKYSDYGLLSTTAEILSDMPDSDVGPILHTLQSHITKEKPIFVYAIGQSRKMDQSQLRYLAVTVDLLWAASLIVDDIVDEDNQRAGMESAWAKYGQEEAYQSAKVTYEHILSNLGKAVSPAAAQAAVRYVEIAMRSLKEHPQLRLDSPMSEFIQNYIDRQDFCCALPVEIIFEGDLDEEVLNLAKEGIREITMAGQILNDLKDMLPRYGWIRANFSDLRNKLVTIPIRILYDHLTEEDQQRLEELYLSPTLTESQHDFVTQLLRQTPALDEILSTIESIYELGMNKLSVAIPDKDQRYPIEQWVNYKLDQCRAVR